MPPEQLPWDRRDFRKHERSASDTRFVSGSGGFGSRWRDPHDPHAPPPRSSHPPAHHHYQNPQQPQRWYSGFRSSRPIVNGHGKQGEWHVYSDEAARGYLPFGSRHNDRSFEDDGSRHLGRHGDERYVRNSRESRGVFTHREWRSPNCRISAGSSGSGKHIGEVGNQKPQEHAPCHNNQSNSGDAAIPVTFLPLDQHKSDLKVNCEDGPSCKSGSCKSGQNIAPSSSLEKPLVELNSHRPIANASMPYNNGKVDELTTAVTVSPLHQHPPVSNEKHEDFGGADDVTRSVQRFEKENTLGSIDWRFLKWSRSGSLSSKCSSHGSFSSSKEDEAHHTSSMGACAAYTVPRPSDNTNSRKKPRLGWGEGLAKYESKKVEGPDNVPEKIDLFSIPNTDTSHSPSGNLRDKSPIHTNLPMSSTSPSSVTCSFSPGMEEHESIKVAGIDQINASIKSALGILPIADYKEPSFNLGSIDELSSVTNLSDLVNGLLQSNDQGWIETGYVKSTSMNTLLVWKANVLKVLEVTESEIDSLETQFRSLLGDSRSCCPHPSVRQSSTGDCGIIPCSKMFNASSFTTGPSLLNLAVPKDVNTGDPTCELEDGKADSPLSNSCKLVDASLPKLFFKTLKHIEYPSTDPINSLNSDQMYCRDVGDIYDSIISSNKDVASKVSDDLNKLLPFLGCSFDASTSSHASSFQRSPLNIKEKIMKRRQILQFSERVLIIKYNVFHHFWKEGRIVSLKKNRRKPHKKFDLFQTMCSIYRSSSHSVGSLPKVPAEEIVDMVNSLLSNFPFKPCRSTLKMPSLILDRNTKSRFISNNGLVDDPFADERERSVLNPWTAEEREIFIGKLAAFGKDFQRIASFLDHKTIADCVEFYYKNHKSECFSRAKRKSDCTKKKSRSSMYLVGARKMYRDSNAVSLDILGEVANASNYIETQLKYKSRIYLGSSGFQNSPSGEQSMLQLIDNLDFYTNERAAVDVLAGVCGSLSSEAMDSCITTSCDPADGNQEWKIQRQSLCIRRPLTPEITHCVDDESLEESCGEIDSTDWTDKEKSMFIHAVSVYGKDFLMISRFLRTRSRDQCRIFFSKARKCLRLDVIQPPEACIASDSTGVDGGDTEGVCVMQNDSSICNIISQEPFDDKPVKENKVSSGHEACAEVETTVESGSVVSKNVQKNDFFTSAEELKDNDTEKTGIMSCKVPIVSFTCDRTMTEHQQVSNESSTVDAVSYMLPKSDENGNACDGKTSCAMPLQKNDLSRYMCSSSMLFPVPIKYQENSCSGDDFQNVCSRGVDAVHSQILRKTGCPSRHSVSFQSNPSNIPNGYHVSVTTCERITWEADNKTQITSHCEECEHPRHQNDTAPQQLHFPGQNGTLPRCQSGEDKPSRNGDLKLFGKVMITLEAKSISAESDGDGKCHKQEPLNPSSGTICPRLPDTTATLGLDHSSLHTIVKSSDCLPDGASVLPGKFLSRCNGLPGANVLQNLKQPQDDSG